jgi:prolipoprotein diacylglyceryltransferase
MFPILNVGPLAIQAPGLIILGGIYLALVVIEKQAKFFKLSSNDLSNLIFVYLLSSIVVGRLAYLIKYPSILIENPLSIVSLNPNLIDFLSGMVLSILIALIYMQKKNMNLREVLDAYTIPFLVFLVFFFFAQFSSGNLFGKPSTLPWSIHLWGTTRHPLQLYYVIGLIPIILLAVKEIKTRPGPGSLFIKSLAFLTSLVVFLDYFNGDPKNVIGNFNIIQLVAWAILIACIGIIITTKKKMQPETN